MHTFPEQGHISSPLLGQQSSDGGLWSALTGFLRGQNTATKGDCARCRSRQYREKKWAKGGGVCWGPGFLFTTSYKYYPAWFAAGTRWVGVCICKSVAPNPTAGGWKAERRLHGTVGGKTGGQEGVRFAVHMSECMCAGFWHTGHLCVWLGLPVHTCTQASSSSRPC